MNTHFWLTTLLIASTRAYVYLYDIKQGEREGHHHKQDGYDDQHSRTRSSAAPSWRHLFLRCCKGDPSDRRINLYTPANFCFMLLPLISACCSLLPSPDMSLRCTSSSDSADVDMGSLAKHSMNSRKLLAWVWRKNHVHIPYIYAYYTSG